MKTETNRVELDDGTVLEVVTDMRDWVAFDMTRAAAKWPPAQDAPMLHRAFLVWSARRRADPGSVPDKFSVDTAPVAIEIVSSQAADPTGPAAPGD